MRKKKRKKNFKIHLEEKKTDVFLFKLLQTSTPRQLEMALKLYLSSVNEGA